MLIDNGTTKTSLQHATTETGDMMLLMLHGNSRDAMQHTQGRAEHLVQKQHVCLCDQQGQDVLG